MGITAKIMSLLGMSSVERSTAGRAHGVIAPLINAEAADIVELVSKMRDDEQVTFAEFTLKACIKRIDVFVTTESDDPRAEALANQLQSLWEKSLDDFLESIAYGRTAFERLFSYDADINLRITECLEYLPFTLTKMKLAEGRFDGITVGRGGNKVELTKDESLWMAIDADALNPHGRSRFLGAPYRVWQRRQKVVGPKGLEEKFLSRFALRGGKAHVQATVTDEKTGQQIDNLAATAEAYQDLLSGGLMIFDNTQTDDGKYANDITESASTLDPMPISNVVDKLDVRMLRAFGIPEKTVIDNGAGSWDLVSLQMLILWAVCEGLISQMIDAFQLGVIDPSVADNFAQDSGVSIKATFTKPSQQPDSVLAEIAKSLLTEGQLSPVVLSGGIDVRKILEAAGIPVTSDLEQRLAVILTRLGEAASQPPLAGLPGAAMSNTQGDLQEGFPPDIPDQHDLQLSALASLEALFAKLVQAASQKNEQAVVKICEQINVLHAQSRVATQVIGRLTPIRPTLQAAPKGSGVRPVSLRKLANIATAANPDGGEEPTHYYSFIDRAAEYLRSKQVLTDAEIQAIPAKVRHSMFSVSGIDSTDILTQIRDAVAASTAAGETHEVFTQRLKDVVALPEATSRTLLRTEMKSAFVEGLDATIQKPAVKAQFPYVRYVATRDGRTRASHRALRDFVCRTDDPAYATLREALRDYNCRCALIPLSEKQAEKYGVKTSEHLPDIVRQEYPG